jgi:hypothetical protein
VSLAGEKLTPRGEPLNGEISAADDRIVFLWFVIDWLAGVVLSIRDAHRRIRGS